MCLDELAQASKTNQPTFVIPQHSTRHSDAGLCVYAIGCMVSCPAICCSMQGVHKPYGPRQQHQLMPRLLTCVKKAPAGYDHKHQADVRQQSC